MRNGRQDEAALGGKKGERKTTETETKTKKDADEDAEEEVERLIGG